MNRSPDRLNLCLSELKGAEQLKNLFIVVSRNDFLFALTHVPQVYHRGNVKSAWSFLNCCLDWEYKFREIKMKKELMRRCSYPDDRFGILLLYDLWYISFVIYFIHFHFNYFLSNSLNVC